MRLCRIIFISIVSSRLIGCGVFRGIPSHGGGKRFDEEERIVAGSIRETLADMDLRELAGKKVLISLQCIAGDGGATVTFPGMSSINAGIGGNIGTGNIVQLTPTDEGGASLLSDNSNKGGSGNLGFTYNPQISYAPTVMSTQPDENYLKAALEMKARHAGLMLVQADPDVILYVLVDVLGTNRSHREDLVSNSDTLEASCQCTYYAQDAKTGKLVFEARQSSSSAAYKETHTFGVRLPEIKRTLERTTPAPLPVDNPLPPSTQPTESAAKKPWLNDVIDRMAGLDDSD